MSLQLLKFLLFQDHLKFAIWVQSYVKTGNKPVYCQLNSIKYEGANHQGTASDARSDWLEFPDKGTEVQLQL
jgi:hypothetical protein